MKFRFSVCGGAAALALALSAFSASAAGPNDAICAMQQAIDCTPTEPCERALPAGVNLPPLMKFDLGAGVIQSRHQDGHVRTSKIGDALDEGGALVLQGVDVGHPWAMRIDSKTGDFELSILRKGEIIVGFGVCSAKIIE